MLITRAYKIRLYPTKAQKVFFNKTFGCCRVIWNEMLYKIEEAYKTGIKLNKSDLFKQIRDKYEWMKEADSQGLCNTYQDLNSAYNNFFNKRAELPRLKKKMDKNSYRNGMGRKIIDKLIDGSKIYIPKAGLVEFRQDYDFSKLRIQKIRNLTIERSKTNKYYCSICCDVEQKEYEHTGQVIGIDLGIKDLVIDSNGNKYSNPKYQVKTEKKIKHLQRLYSKKVKGSHNAEKARLKLATAHEKLCNKRKDNLHKITTKLIRENDVICIENLAVKNMMKNHKLANAIQDASFGTIAKMLKYKATWHGRSIVEIGRFYPSSKLCSCCGHKMLSMPLSVREWTCPSCGASHDRDINAAINIKNEGLRLLDNQGTVRNTGTLGEYPSKLVENPTMDERLDVLKSSDSEKQELLYKVNSNLELTSSKSEDLVNYDRFLCWLGC